MSKRTRYIGGSVLAVVIAALAVMNGTNAEMAEDPIQKHLKVAGVDVKDSAAMAKWAHGMCQGQTVEHLAAVYGVEATMTAVVKELARYLPLEMQPIVAHACEEELKKSARSA